MRDIGEFRNQVIERLGHQRLGAAALDGAGEAQFEVAFGIEPQREGRAAAVLQGRAAFLGNFVRANLIRQAALLADHFGQGHIAMDRDNFAAFIMAHVVPAEIGRAHV